MTSPVAACFISYNHADEVLAQAIHEGLTAAGYRVWIDEGELRVGDSLITAVSEAIDRVDFLVALVSEHSVSSNWCQKEISLAMTGEVGRRGITVLPCRVGAVEMPPALADKLYLTVSADDPSNATASLNKAMTQHLAPAEPLPPRCQGRRTAPIPFPTDTYGPGTEVRMTGIDTNSMTSPRNDGTPGSALYRVPITLSVSPDRTWAELFVRHWDQSSQWTVMHRPGIASVSGARIILNGTTVEEVERYHVATLKLAVNAANTDRRALADRDQAERERAAQDRRAQDKAARDVADRIRFDPVTQAVQRKEAMSSALSSSVMLATSMRAQPGVYAVLLGHASPLVRASQPDDPRPRVISTSERVRGRSQSAGTPDPSRFDPYDGTARRTTRPRGGCPDRGRRARRARRHEPGPSTRLFAG